MILTEDRHIIVKKILSRIYDEDWTREAIIELPEDTLTDDEL